MSWKPHATIAGNILALRSASRSIGNAFRVLGETLTDLQLRELVRDTLGVDDAVDDPRQVEAHITATIADPILLPETLAGIGHAPIIEDDVSLARHMGVDPLRLLLAGRDTIAMVSDEARRIRAIPLWAARRLDRVDIAFTLGKGVTWRNGTLRASNTVIPHTVMDSLQGRTLDGIVGHGWEGWKRLRVKSAHRSGHTLVVTTDAQAETSLSRL